MDPIRHTLSLNADLDAAYRAVATPEGLHGWWAADGDIATEVGGETELRFMKDGNPVTMKFRVDALDEGKRVAWTCIDNANPIWVGSTLTWEFETTESGSRLAFAHEGFTAGGPPYDMTAQGWQHFMASLATYVDTGTGQPW